jgi:hypothetical protein
MFIPHSLLSPQLLIRWWGEALAVAKDAEHAEYAFAIIADTDASASDS